MVAPRVGERRARVVDHARGTGVPRLDRREDVRGLAVVARLEDRLAHPDVVAVVLRVGVLAVLPVRSPAAVRSVRQVDEALLLARDDRRRCRPRSGCRDRRRRTPAGCGCRWRRPRSRIRPVRIAPRRPGWDAPRLAGLVDDVQPDVADFPVQAAVRADRHARDAVTTEGRMGVEALADRGPLVEHAVAVGVAQPIDARRDTDDEVAVVQRMPPRMSKAGSSLNPSKTRRDSSARPSPSVSRMR